MNSDEETKNEILNYIFDTRGQEESISEHKITGQKIDRVVKLEQKKKQISDTEVERQFPEVKPHGVSRNARTSVEPNKTRRRHDEVTQQRKTLKVPSSPQIAEPKPNSALEKRKKIFATYTQVSKRNGSVKKKVPAVTVKTDCPFHEVSAIEALIENIHNREIDDKREPAPPKETKVDLVEEKAEKPYTENSNRINLKGIPADVVKPQPVPDRKESRFDELVVVKPTHRTNAKLVFRSKNFKGDQLDRFRDIVKMEE